MNISSGDPLYEKLYQQYLKDNRPAIVTLFGKRYRHITDSGEHRFIPLPTPDGMDERYSTNSFK